MSKIFISYRRQDSAGVAGRIYDRLSAHFGDDALFMDMDSIPFGLDFRGHITSAVNQCDVLLAVIGRQWAGETGTPRRIDDPRDFVRIEIEAALKRGLPVIPILIDRAPMPGEADLPASLAPLAYRNAIEVDQGRDFHHHVDRLIRGLERLLPQPHLTSAASPGARERPFGPVPSAQEPQPPSSQSMGAWTNSIGMNLKLIPAGEFQMGSTESDDEKPRHLVTISRPFYLGVYPVTQREYMQVVKKNPSQFSGNERLPVETVSWFDAVEFCNALSRKEGLPPFYSVKGQTVEVPDWNGLGYRLPTEAEWECACRAGTTARFSLGDDENALGQYAWYSANSGNQTHTVGEKKPNALGLYDMHGNVWEWCWDGYDAAYYKQSPAVDPRGPGAAASRVIRGGSWYHDPQVARSAFRFGYSPGSRDYNLGCRLARVQSGR
jgi:formylglycine-generating enzyme required for sulfatase activity